MVLQKGIRRNLLAALALVPVIAWTNGEWSRHDEDPASEGVSDWGAQTHHHASQDAAFGRSSRPAALESMAAQCALLCRPRGVWR